FSVAPVHYYANDPEVDIANNKFGVVWSSYDFQSKVIQSQLHQEVPVGAGAFMATNRDNADNPKGDEFVKSNIVYYKANENFEFPVKAKKLRFQVVSSANALDKLASNEVDFVTPQFTLENSNRINSMKSKGYEELHAWQLGYGYIGVNAGKVSNINLRKAIMSAMNTSLATEFYASGTCKTIAWPMSMESWAYPYEDPVNKIGPKENTYDYMNWEGDAAAKEKIESYTEAAHASANDLKITFTIAGSSITEHPTYKVFKKASELLNECGWKVEVKADSQALTKLSTGSLAVWAAAWGSTVDPDMYQVYHKNSTATSVYAWGYREIKANSTKYSEENRIINDLSAVIDDARSINDKGQRRNLYETAMNYVLQLAVEMPVYQRMNLYAYNANTITGISSEVNPYSSPLERIWELELK
ncbi:MAG: ABC transporter substrate-binding protein, partial [Clostridia bacterium]|nr:ABC transporter substrate-binding protein [Clostridia bacterium]